MSNVTGLITLNGKEFLEVDGDPSLLTGTPSDIGSVALWNTGAVGKMYLKIGAADTAWDFVPTYTQGNVASGTFLRLALYDTNSTGAHVADTVQLNGQSAHIAIASQGTRTAPIDYIFPNPGDTVSAANVILSEGAQTINGVKTFGNAVIINGDLTVNGTTTFVNSQQLQVSDPIITLNKGAGLGTGSNVGFEIEEGSVITGYLKTNASRNGYVFLAPAISSSLTLDMSGLTAARTLTAPNGSGTAVIRPNATIGVAGQVAFWQDANNVISNANLFWDQTNSRLGIGISTPSVALHVVGSARITGLNAAQPVKTDVNGNLSNGLISLTSDVSNILPIANGGTNMSTLGSANQFMMVNAAGTALGYRTLQGTTNQVDVTFAAGTITLATPQNIHTTATPVFSGMTLSTLTAGSVVFSGTSGLISQNNSNFFWDNSNNRLGLATNSPSRTLDVNGSSLFRSSMKFVDSSASNANWEMFQAQTSTTTNTQTTLASISIPADTVVVIEASVQGHRTGGTAGTVGDAATYIRTARFKNVGGTVTKSREQADFTSEDQPSWDATFDVNGTSARIRVTGATNNNINWTTTYNVQVLA